MVSFHVPCSSIFNSARVDGRQMMRRDRDDPEKGSEYVAKAYPLKVAYCLPILVTQKAHDLRPAGVGFLAAV